jgi:hypothetical protein
MALVTSYETLKTAITEETDGRAQTASLDRYIQSAEGEIKAYLHTAPVHPMRARTTISIDGEYVAAPVAMVRPIAVEVTISDRVVYLPFVAPENLSKMQSKDTGSNDPYAFTRIGSELRFYPVPESTFSAVLHYYQTIPALTDSNTTTWLLDEFPNVYHAGALYYAYRDMPDVEKAGLMKSVFDDALVQVLNSYPEHDDETTLSVDPSMIMGLRQWQTL